MAASPTNGREKREGSRLPDFGPPYGLPHLRDASLRPLKPSALSYHRSELKGVRQHHRHVTPSKECLPCRGDWRSGGIPALVGPGPRCYLCSPWWVGQVDASAASFLAFTVCLAANNSAIGGSGRGGLALRCPWLTWPAVSARSSSGPCRLSPHNPYAQPSTSSRRRRVARRSALCIVTREQGGLTPNRDGPACSG